MKLICFATALFLLPATAMAQDAPTGLRGEILQQLGAWENQILSLAEEASEDLFDWRPADGVRSFGEALLHIAGAIYYMTGMVGSPPEGVNPRELEGSVAGKEAIIETARASFDHARGVITNMSDDDLEQTTTWFSGEDVTYRAVLTFMNAHSAEHLGQMIAYGRMNGLVPPWSN